MFSYYWMNNKKLVRGRIKLLIFLEEFRPIGIFFSKYLAEDTLLAERRDVKFQLPPPSPPFGQQ